MFAACQRLRRRALVVLTWLVLALSVAPAPVDSDAATFVSLRPVAAFVSELSARRAGGVDLARVQRGARVVAAPRLPGAQRAPLPLFFRQARGATRADASPWPAPDERWLYLKNAALLC
jgi:hypothetical protein